MKYDEFCPHCGVVREYKLMIGMSYCRVRDTLIPVRAISTTCSECGEYINIIDALFEDQVSNQ